MKESSFAHVATGFCIDSENGDYYINDTPINPDSFEEIGYAIVEKEDEIENITSMYGEAVISSERSSDASLMKKDITYLLRYSPEANASQNTTLKP